MKSEAWTSKRLGEVFTLTRGASYSSADLTGDGLLIGLKTILPGGGFRSDGPKPFSGKHRPDQVLQPGNLVMALTDITQDGFVLGSPAIVPDLAATPLVASLDIAKVDVASSAHRHFIYYLLSDPSFREWAAGHASGTTIRRIKATDVQERVISLPPPDEQGRIAGVLGALDGKIESNRRLAKTLERIAATLFKARFVDFVEHDDLVKSEIGPIPGGWSVIDIYEVASVTYGRPFKSSLFNDSDGVPLLRIRDLATHEPQIYTAEHRDDVRLIKAGDIVVGMDGEFRAHIWSGPDSWLNQRVCAFDPLSDISRAFVLGSIGPPLAFFEATKSGTTVIHLGKRDIDTFRIVRPPEAVMEAFREEADPLLLNAVAARKQSRTLAAIRDALLPRLISGQIRVPADAELASEAV